VLYRNGVLTQTEERTLVVEVTGIKVPAPGVTVTLEIETQHGDPDFDGSVGPRISVWRESLWIAPSLVAPQKGITALFALEFGATVAPAGQRFATPTDYFRYEVTVTDADHPATDPAYAFGEDYAFLMESQWVARLPEVDEQSPGAAPDELIVYYADMIPFRQDAGDPATWLPREEVTDYVGTELLPQMVEAFRVQTDEWGYPWYPAWTSRRSEDGERLGVALSDGETWFHGPAPANKGLSDISLNVSAGNAAYDTLTDGLMSTFHHELFHNQQRSIHLHQGGEGWVSGRDNAWQFFSEGTATLAASVGQPDVQFTQTVSARSYMDHANRFVRRGKGRFQELITDLERVRPYSAALYWRFLYEQCGGMQAGVEDPAAGMQIVRRALTVLYSGEVVDVDASTDLLGATPEVLDRALAGSTCPFQSYEESLVAFARALYGLRVGGGRCVEPGVPAGCGFYDPHALYGDPPVRTVVFSGEVHEYQSRMMSNHDTDWIDVVFAPAAEGWPLTVELKVSSASGVELDVQVLRLADAYESARSQHDLIPTAAAEACAEKAPGGPLVCVIPEIRTAHTNRLGLIITRLDAQERSESAGEYTVVLRPNIE
jgi:hypothetical protein